jgi:GNAT superfamily N-acetyltransferase
MSSTVEPFDEVKRISDGLDCSGFDCGNPEFNDFIRNDALTDQRNGYSITYAGMIGGALAAFVTLIAAAYRTEDFRAAGRDGYHYRDIPAVKIARMATDRKVQRNGCGRALVDYSFKVALEVKKNIGCRLLITDALPERVDWYVHRGFDLTTDAKRTAPGRKTYPMHADLQPPEPPEHQAESAFYIGPSQQL